MELLFVPDETVMRASQVQVRHWGGRSLGSCGLGWGESRAPGTLSLSGSCSEHWNWGPRLPQGQAGVCEILTSHLPSPLTFGQDRDRQGGGFPAKKH